MKKLRLFISALVVAFSILGLTKALTTDITMPITFVCLALVMFITSKEYKDKQQKSTAIHFLVLGVFLLVVTAYNVATICNLKSFGRNEENMQESIAQHREAINNLPEMKQDGVVYTLMVNDEPITENTVYVRAGDVVFSLKAEISDDVAYKRKEANYLSTSIYESILDIDYPAEMDGRDGTVVSTCDYHMKGVPVEKIIHVTITEELQQRLGLDSNIVEIHCK